MTEIRCVKCNRLLMKISDPLQIDLIAISRKGVETKCSKCGYINKFTFCINMEKPDLNNIEVMRLS